MTSTTLDDDTSSTVLVVQIDNSMVMRAKGNLKKEGVDVPKKIPMRDGIGQFLEIILQCILSILVEIQTPV